MTVHPHAHGDNIRLGGTLSLGLGSPPCTWGQRHLQRREQLLGRFTPMYMGTTSDLVKWGRACPVHPHVHGDNDRTAPPPAPNGTVHPHVHGDNFLLLFAIVVPLGPPPCTWGQQPDAVPRVGRLRFTPMYMGTTLLALKRRTSTPVHPHAHGDNVFSSRPTSRGSGSPPCTWGQPNGSIWPRRACPVHPHVHGDNSSKYSTCRYTRGSPPYMARSTKTATHEK